MFAKSKDVIGKLAKRSQNTLDIFNKTITELASQNAEVDACIEERTAEMKRLQKEQEDLGAIKATNQKVIEKINKIFE